MAKPLTAEVIAEVIADPTPGATPTTLDALVDAWFVAHFHNRSPALDSEAYNVIYAATQDLKKRLPTI